MRIIQKKDEQRATDLFLIENEPQFANELRVVAVILKGDKAESLGSASFAVDHDCGIDDLSECGKESTHGIGRGLRRQTSDEIARVAQVFLAWDRAFRIDLCGFCFLVRNRGVALKKGEQHGRLSHLGNVLGP